MGHTRSGTRTPETRTAASSTETGKHQDTDGQTKLGAERVVILKSFRSGRMILSISPGLVREQPKPCRRPGGGRGRPGHWSPGAGRARGWAQEPTRHLHVPPARPSAARRARVLCVHYTHRYGRVPRDHVSANGGWRARRVPRDCRGAETFPWPSEAQRAASRHEAAPASVAMLA